MILKKVVRRFGAGAHVIVPKHMIGKPIVMFIDSDLQRLKDLMSTNYIWSKLGATEFQKVDFELERLKDNVFPRLAFLERTVASMVGKGTESRKRELEPERSPPASEPLGSDSEGSPPQEGSQKSE